MQARSTDDMNGLATVIVPVHNAAEELGCCLASVARTVPSGAEVLVIDDASEDPAVERLLGPGSLPAGPRWRIERQDRNLGFVGTANRGMQLTRGDVVLLNSDTEVTPGWLEGLSRCLQSGPDIATATPWTNNGEIVSIPKFCEANPPPPDADAVARAVASAGCPDYPELPTAVGFCLAIRRRAIETLGVFDADLFGAGYGEENDFSMRAIQAGMRNVLCDDVYVVHHGGRSFGPKGLRPGEDAMMRVLSRHPTYLEEVRSFIRSDPLAPRREEVIRCLRRAGVAMR